MCNRYKSTRDIERLRTIFANAPSDWLTQGDSTYDTVYPKSSVPVVLRVRGEQMFNNFQWGIHPSWSDKKSMILTNTKSEEVLKKPTWITSFQKRRCLMPAEAFYEPATVDGKKYQMRFELKSGSPFCFAAIWEKTDRFGEPKNCCSLLTCEPNTLVGEIHERMPVILRPEHYDLYLDTPAERVADLLEILTPFPPDEMKGEFDSTST